MEAETLSDIIRNHLDDNGLNDDGKSVVDIVDEIIERNKNLELEVSRYATDDFQRRFGDHGEEIKRLRGLLEDGEDKLKRIKDNFISFSKSLDLL